VAALTEIYVDPAINANSGSGTIGDPYGDLQYAFNTATRDATNGNRFNVKAGASEVLTAKLSLATYGTPGTSSQLVIQGYTSVAGDGGRGEISLGGGSFVALPTQNWLSIRDLRFHNAAPASYVLVPSVISSNKNIKIDNVTGGFAISLDGEWVDLWVEDCSGGGVFLNTTGYLAGGYLKNGSSKKFATALYLAAGIIGLVATNVIVSVDGATNGCYLGSYCGVRNLTVFSNGGTGIGIRSTTHSAFRMQNVYVEGFSGAGGVGFSYATEDAMSFRHNAAFNNTTNYSLTGDAVDTYDNEVLGISGIAKSGSDTFANRLTYFAPINTGNMFAGHLGQKGAVPPAASSSGLIRGGSLTGGFQ